MKKLYFFLLGICLFSVIITGCQSNKDDTMNVVSSSHSEKNNTTGTENISQQGDVELIINNNVIKKGDTKLECNLKNLGETEYIYGLDYKIEQKEGNSWIEAKISNKNITDIAYTLSKGSSEAVSYSIDGLKSGEYRVLIDVTNQSDGKIYVLSSEFCVE